MTQICKDLRSSPLSDGDGCITKDPSGRSREAMVEGLQIPEKSLKLNLTFFCILTLRTNTKFA